MKKISLYTQSVLYVVAGTNHFIHPGIYLQIMPPWIGWHELIVYVSGALEILFAILLLFVYTRRMAAWCIIILLIVIFPANIQMMLDYFHKDDPHVWITVLRLPLQFVLIWWAYSFTKPAALKVSANK